jgi:hypothetical protein
LVSDETLNPLAHRRLRRTNRASNAGIGNAAILLQKTDNAAIMLVDIS